VLITPVHDVDGDDGSDDASDAPDSAFTPSDPIDERDTHTNGSSAGSTRDDTAGAYAGQLEEDDVRRG
jgi:hypothetical protein